MKISKLAALAAMLACVSQPVVAGPKYVVQPVPVGTETIRFDQGVPTVDLQREKGVVQITPLPLDRGSLSFGVAVFNGGDTPANIDITNFEISVGERPLPVFSREELEKKAKNRAMWQSIALAAVGGLAAVAAANQRDHYTHTMRTPRGTYRSHFSAPSTAGQIQSAAIAAGTGFGIAAVQRQLDETRAALGEEIVQLTTVDPGESYAGRIVLTKAKVKALPQHVSFVVRWNGESYPFAFRLAKQGTPQPEFVRLTPAEPSTDVSPTIAPAAIIETSAL